MRRERIVGQRLVVGKMGDQCGVAEEKAQFLFQSVGLLFAAGDGDDELALTACQLRQCPGRGRAFYTLPAGGRPGGWQRRQRQRRRDVMGQRLMQKSRAEFAYDAIIAAVVTGFQPRVDRGRLELAPH